MWTIAIILIVLWGLGLTSGFVMGGLLHALLVIAVVLIALQYTGRLARRAPR